MLARLHELWALRGLNPKVIQDALGLSTRVYLRALREHCTVEQVKFMPSDMLADELKLLVELASQSVFVGTIAKKLDRGRKQVSDCIKRLGMTPCTKDPNRWSSTISKLELSVVEALKARGFAVEQQYVVGNFVFDARITGTNVLIEVHGDYWHCNPRVYTTGPINDTQRKMRMRDFCKRDTAKKFGFKRLVVWEADLRRNFSEAITRLKGWIEAHEDEGAVRAAGTPVPDDDAERTDRCLST